MSATFQAWVDVKVYDSTKLWNYEKVAGRRPPFSCAQYSSLGLQSWILANHRTSGTGHMRPKWRCLMHSAMFNKNTAHEHKHLTPAVNHGGGEVIIWVLQPQDFGSLQSLSQLWISLYTKVFKSNMTPSVWQLKLCSNWVMQKENDPTVANLLQTVWKRKESSCYNYPSEFRPHLWVEHLCCT